MRAPLGLTLPFAKRSPDAFDRFAERMAERVNPIVVKEIRQGLRTRAFWIFFSLMLFACLIISLIAAAASGDFNSDGKAYFIAYDVCLGLVQYFVIPYSAYRSMAREREEETWVLLTLTGLGPKAILRGKMLSFMLQGVLYTSAAAPFLLFSYYLNGIDLPTIVVSLIGGVIYQLFLTSLCVSIATLAETKLARGVLHFITLGLLFQGIWGGIGATVGLIDGIRDLWATPAAQVTVVAVLFGMLTWGVLLFEAAAARMSLATENYSRGPRLVLVVQLLGQLALLGWGLIGTQDETLTAVGSLTACAHLFVVGLFVASDHDGMSRALWLKGRLSLLKPGALRGYRLVVLLAVVIAAFYGWAAYALHAPSRLWGACLAAPGYALIYLSLPLLLSRAIRSGANQRPVVARVFGLGILILGSGGPPLFAALLGADPGTPGVNVLNPVVGLINLLEDRTEPALQLAVVGLTALALVVATHSMLRAADNPPAREKAA